MNIIIRPEEKRDYDEVEKLTREAFWDIYKPGCDEHLLAHKLRKTTAFIPELDFVAEFNGRIVGNIMYSKAKVIDENASGHEVITFGPVSVLPEMQKRSIGSKLIEHTKRLAAKLGYRGIFIYGNPAYYHRFGFQNAERFGISTSEGSNFDEFMALELYPGALEGISGRFCEDSVFKIDTDELEEFEQKFPFREKHITDTQLK